MEQPFSSVSVPLPRDLRYGLRKLNQNTGFTVVAVVCLALGICASVTVFSELPRTFALVVALTVPALTVIPLT